MTDDIHAAAERWKRQQYDGYPAAKRWFCSVKLHDSAALADAYCELLDQQRRAVRAMVRAFLELNTIRARDGVPWTHNHHRADVDEEYFSSVVDELDAVVTAMTGHSAHCHPELYKHD